MLCGCHTWLACFGTAITTVVKAETPLTFKAVPNQGESFICFLLLCKMCGCSTLGCFGDHPKVFQFVLIGYLSAIEVQAKTMLDRINTDVNTF